LIRDSIYFLKTFSVGLIEKLPLGHARRIEFRDAKSQESHGQMSRRQTILQQFDPRVQQFLNRMSVLQLGTIGSALIPNCAYFDMAFSGEEFLKTA